MKPAEKAVLARIEVERIGHGCKLNRLRQGLPAVNRLLRPSLDIVIPSSGAHSPQRPGWRPRGAAARQSTPVRRWRPNIFMRMKSESRLSPPPPLINPGLLFTTAVLLATVSPVPVLATVVPPVGL